MTLCLRVLCAACAFGLLVPASSRAAFDAVLQGQSAGSTNWISNNLRNWRELDLVPARVYLTGGPVTARSLTVEIDHYKAGTPGIEDLSGFRASPNVVITSGPILSAPAGAETWSYAFIINFTDNKPSYIEFRARLASGSRFNSGSSLHLYGAPSLGVLQFHKINPAGTPDLVVTKTGPFTTTPGELITYTLSYSNRTSANSAAGNVQLRDALPSGLTFAANSASQVPSSLGSILTWNLGILDPGANGRISFQATVAQTATNRQVLENMATIASDQADANLADNTARFRTTVAFNTPPLARDDAYTVVEDNTLTIAAPGVMANDSSADGNPLSASLLTSPQHGELSLLSNGSFMYIPAPDFNGSDQFDYQLSDGTTNSAPARVTITVTPDNDPPTARPDAYELLEDMALIIQAPGVLGNDADIDSLSLQALIVSNPSHGTLQLASDGGFEFVPNKDFFGNDSFAYRAGDGSAHSAPITVALSVLPVNDPPAFTKGPNQLVAKNSAAQTVPGWATEITSGPANESGQVVHFLASVDRPELFLTPPAISADGTLTYAPAPDAHGTAVVTVVLKDDGGTDSGGNDTSAPATFTIRINAPPTVNIIIPTNGTVFMAPANITILAEAQDPDGTIAHVQLFESTNQIAHLTDAPHLTVASNMPASAFEFLARATDDLGAVGVSAPVLITVIERPPVVTGAIRFNPQSGLFEQPVRISNPSSFDFSAVCVFVSNLTTRCEVYNRSGISNGLPFVQYNSPVPSGQSADMLIEYYDSSRVIPEPVLFAEAVQQLPPVNPVGTDLRVSRQRWLADGTFLIEFNSRLGRSYYVQYCDEVPIWKTSLPSINGTGTRSQWIDNGPPRTESPPARTKTRLYRVVLVP